MFIDWFRVRGRIWFYFLTFLACQPSQLHSIIQSFVASVSQSIILHWVPVRCQVEAWGYGYKQDSQAPCGAYVFYPIPVDLLCHGHWIPNFSILPAQNLSVAFYCHRWSLSLIGLLVEDPKYFLASSLATVTIREPSTLFALVGSPISTCSFDFCPSLLLFCFIWNTLPFLSLSGVL